MFRDILNNSEHNQIEQLRLLRQYELQAYSGVINAFSAQGELTERKKRLLKELQASLSISIERHKAEIRRALNDDIIESVSNVNGETRSEWIIEGKRSILTRRRAVPDTYATKIANSKSKQIINERANILRPKYKFLTKISSSKRVEFGNKVDNDGISNVVENGGETSTVDDDNESGTGTETLTGSIHGKLEVDQSSVTHDPLKFETENDKAIESKAEPLLPTVQVTKEIRTATTTIPTHIEEVPREEVQESQISRTCATTLPESKPVISAVQSLYGKSSIVIKPTVDHHAQSSGCIPNIKQVASTVTIGTSETPDIPVSVAPPTPVSIQQSNIKLLNRPANIIVVHRPSKLTQSSRITIPQSSNNRSIRVIRQDGALSSSQSIHSSTATESRVSFSSASAHVSTHTTAHTYSGVMNVDLDSDTPPLPQIPPQTAQIKPKPFLQSHTQPQAAQQSIQIQQTPSGDVYHVPQASNDTRMITPHSGVATYQKPDSINYSTMEVRKLELQPVLRDQLQHATQKSQAQHQQQLLVLQAHVPQAQHQEQKPLQPRLFYTQTPAHSIQRNSSPPPTPSQPQQLQIQLQMQRQQQLPTQAQQITQASLKQGLPPVSIAHLTQQASSQHQQLIQSQPHIQLAANQPQIQLQQHQTPQIQLQQPQPIMLTQSLKPQQFQMSAAQQQTVTIDDQNTLKNQMKQESQQLLLLKGQLVQIQSIGGEQAAKARPVASLINESPLSPNKRLKPETSNKRKISESFGDWQAEMLPLISNLLDGCLLDNASLSKRSVDEQRGLVKQDTASDNQEKMALMRMKESLLSRQYLNQQTFENDMKQLQASCLKKYAVDDKKRIEMEDLFSTFYRDLRILKQSSAEAAEPPAKVKIFESG